MQQVAHVTTCPVIKTDVQQLDYKWSSMSTGLIRYHAHAVITYQATDTRRGRIHYADRMCTLWSVHTAHCILTLPAK